MLIQDMRVSREGHRFPTNAVGHNKTPAGAIFNAGPGAKAMLIWIQERKLFCYSPWKGTFLLTMPTNYLNSLEKIKKIKKFHRESTFIYSLISSIWIYVLLVCTMGP